MIKTVGTIVLPDSTGDKTKRSKGSITYVEGILIWTNLETGNAHALFDKKFFDRFDAPEQGYLEALSWIKGGYGSPEWELTLFDNS